MHGNSEFDLLSVVYQLGCLSRLLLGMWFLSAYRMMFMGLSLHAVSQYFLFLEGSFSVGLQNA